MGQTTQTRKIVISVDTNGAAGLKDMADKLGSVSRSTKQMAEQMDRATTAFLGFIAGISVRQLASFSDEIQNLNNRLLAMGGGSSEAIRTMNQLVQTSRDTNQSLSATAETYFRMSLALKDAHVTTDTLIEVTKTIANTFRLSGASAQEAANATIQLGQAFSLGVLRGQDLRSVMSQNVVLTRLLRKEFGNNLLKEAEKGLITVPRLMEILFKNMKSVDEQAKLMSATFEQTAVKAFDAFKLKIFEVSQALGAPSAFAQGMNLAIVNMGAIVTVGGILATATLPAIISRLYALAAGLGSASLLAAGLAVGLTAVVAIFGEGFDITKLITQFKSGFENLQAIVLNFRASVLETFALLGTEEQTKAIREKAASLRITAKLHEYNADAIWKEYDANVKLQEEQKKTADAAARQAADLAKIKNAFKIEEDPTQFLSRINKEFLATGDSAKYFANVLDYDLYKAMFKFKEGKATLEQLNEAQRKVDLKRLNEQFQRGAITIDQFQAASRNIELGKLNDELKAGKINIDEFNSKLAGLTNSFSANAALRTGLTDYIKGIGTVTQQVAGLIKGTFDELETEMLDFIKTGKFNFEKFTQSILDDLTKIIVRATIIQPLAQGLLNFVSTPSTTNSTTLPASNGNYSNYAANGAYFDGTMAKFANGAIFNKPTTFGYGRGKTGVMGEAGPEAILPLSRDGGKLGVAASVTPVNINIINNSGAQVEQQETTGPNGEKTLDILITNKVRDGIASGRYDKAFSQTYGLRRKGM